LAKKIDKVRLNPTVFLHSAYVRVQVGRQKVQALYTEAHKRLRSDFDSSDEENISPPVLPRKKAKLKAKPSLKVRLFSFV
jgi:hypothetical protein